MGRATRDRRRLRRRVRIGAPDPSLTRFSGMVAVTELVDRLGMIGLLDAAIGPIKQRDRGFTGGQLLVGMAARAAGRGGLPGRAGPPPRRRRRAGARRRCPGWRSTTAAGLARRFTDGQWRAVETGLGDVARRRAGSRCCAAAAGGGAVRDGDDRPGHHRCRGLRPPQARGGVQPPGPAGRAPARGHLGRDRDRAGRGPDGRQRRSPPRTPPELLRRALAGAARPGPGRADPAARRRRLLRRAAGPRRAVRRGRVRHRRPADRPAVADPRRGRRDRLDRRDRHDRRAGRGGRLLPGLVARRDPAADPPGPPRRRPPGRSPPIRGPGGAAPCTPTSAPCRSTSSPTPTRSTATRSS